MFINGDDFIAKPSNPLELRLVSSEFEDVFARIRNSLPDLMKHEKVSVKATIQKFVVSESQGDTRTDFYLIEIPDIPAKKTVTYYLALQMIAVQKLDIGCSYLIDKVKVFKNENGAVILLSTAHTLLVEFSRPNNVAEDTQSIEGSDDQYNYMNG